MNPRLGEACNQIRGLLAKETRGSAQVRYCIGAIVRRVEKGGRRYGSRAVEKLALALGLDDSTLYVYAQVAGRWNKRAFKSLLGRKGKYGLPLSWSHLAELALVEDNERREGLIQATLQKGLSVRDLKRQIAFGPTEDDSLPDEGSESSAPAEGRARVPTSVANGLVELTTLAKSWVERATHLQTTVFTPLFKADRDEFDDEFIQQIKQARDAQRLLSDACKESLDQLDACLARLDATPAGKAKTPAGKNGKTSAS